MRSFEFAEGTSAKFWEIRRDGAEVTVRFGRVGTAGQTKVKTFADDGLAAVHEGKLIAEKTRKGYAEVSSPTAAMAVPAFSPAPAPMTPAPAAAAPAAPVPADEAAPVPADEDAFVVPPAWYRYRCARRGSAGVGRFIPDAKARKIVDEEIGRIPNQVRRILESPGTGPAIRGAAFAWLGGDAGAQPVGAAAVVVAAALGRWADAGRMAAFADVWIAERGLQFAVEAAVELMALKVAEDGPRKQGHPDYAVRAMHPIEERQGWQPDVPLIIAWQVREALAAASAEDYTAAVALLSGYRAGHPYQRAATSILAPDRAEWVAEDIAAAAAAGDSYLGMGLLTAAGTGDQATTLASLVHTWAAVSQRTLLNTFAEGVGPACAPALFRWFDDDRGADAQRRLLAVLTVLPGDAVMAGLIERADAKYVMPALLEAVERFPARGLRLLAEAGGRRDVADLLRAHILAHTELIDAVRPALSPAAAARVDAIASTAASFAVADASAVPPLLTDPPWQHRTKAAKPIVIPGLTCTDPATIEWLPGERETWSQAPAERFHGRDTDDWAQVAKRILLGRTNWYEPIRFFAQAPELIARPVVARWKPAETYDSGTWMRVIAARFELDALRPMLHLAGKAPTEIAAAFLPYASPEIAVHMADWLARLKSVRRTAMTWLLRHAAPAARALVPAALDKPGPARRQAERALLVLHTNGHTETVRAAAASYGPAPAAAIEALLATDPLTVLPARLPAAPAWAVPGLLPPVPVRGNGAALPAEAVTNLLTVLALSKLDDPYPGVAIVKQACDPPGLAEFGWGLFQRWQAAGANAKESWVLDALGLIGDDETVRRLTPLILAWPGEGGHAKAVTGVGVLATIGSDVALMHLHGIAQRARFKGLKAAAEQKMDDVAAALGLSAEQLADRLVPDFGLDSDGSLRLDYGPRQFVVGFDEQLRPYVTDAAGKHLKALPKPGARDDAALGEAAYKRFAALKKDARTVATDQIRRLERAMVTGRRWSGTDFRRLFVDHPLLWHIVRRLVWGIYDSTGTLIGAIRVAEDRTFSTMADDATTIADDALVGVVHPLQLAGDLATWSELFADYEILQPFPQLSRETFALTPDEAAASRLTRFEGITLPTTKVMGLERRGWRREQPQDGGVQGAMELKLAPRLEVAIELDPGIIVGMPTEFAEQKLTEIYLHDGTYSSWSRHKNGLIPLGRLDPVAASEIVRDLTEITA